MPVCAYVLALKRTTVMSVKMIPEAIWNTLKWYPPFCWRFDGIYSLDRNGLSINLNNFPGLFINWGGHRFHYMPTFYIVFCQAMRYSWHKDCECRK